MSLKEQIEYLAPEHRYHAGKYRAAEQLLRSQIECLDQRQPSGLEGELSFHSCYIRHQTTYCLPLILFMDMSVTYFKYRSWKKDPTA
jgi:hypothetical protein